MKIKTLIIGFTPLSDTVGKKPREIRDDTYIKELLSKFDFGEVHYASHTNWKQVTDEINPLFIIYFGSEYSAQEIQDYKKDALLYVTCDAGQIFYRKAETEAKKRKQHTIFTEIAGLVEKMKNDEAQITAARKFAAMSYDDMYRMIIQAIIGKDENLRKSAWDLLMDNNGHQNFVWMRVQLICEIWQKTDGKGKEEFLCMAMDQHIDEEMARKLENFTDSDGQQYHQYIFCDFFGCDVNYIRRIPFGFKGQDPWAYEALLTQYETPTGPRMMMEAGQMRSKKKEYFKGEAEKVTRVLKSWKEDSARSKKELGVVALNEEDSDSAPLTEKELTSIKNFLKKHDKTAYESLFDMN